MRLTPPLSPVALAVLALLALAVAGVTHAATVLMLPWRSHRDAFARVAALGPPGSRATLPTLGVVAGAGTQAPVPFADPALLTNVCRYDLHSQSFRVTLPAIEDSFVTVGFHTRHGVAFNGFTRRAGDQTPLEFRLVEQATGRPAIADLDEHVITVESPDPEGFVSIATPLGADAAEARARLAGFTCGTGAYR